MSDSTPSQDSGPASLSATSGGVRQWIGNHGIVPLFICMGFTVNTQLSEPSPTVSPSVSMSEAPVPSSDTSMGPRPSPSVSITTEIGSHVVAQSASSAQWTPVLSTATDISWFESCARRRWFKH